MTTRQVERDDPVLLEQAPLGFPTVEKSRRQPLSELVRCADFFAGIGGMRTGFERAGKGRVKTVFANDFDNKCKETYNANFDDPFLTIGDIREVHADNIPEFDIMIGGFPCQAFSQAGRKLGFADARGTLFFELARILKAKHPKAFLLENVGALRNHDNGRTLGVIKNTLANLGYDVHMAMLNSRFFGVPQNRPRLYIVGFDRRTEFEFPAESGESRKIKDILEHTPPDSVYLSQKYYEGVEKHRKRHESKGNGFGYVVLDKNGVANTLVVGGMGRERNLIQDKPVSVWSDGEDKLQRKNIRGLRRLTVREFARCQGFDDSFRFPVANSHAYKQIANSISVPVIEAIARQMLKFL